MNIAIAENYQGKGIDSSLIDVAMSIVADLRKSTTLQSMKTAFS
jgi:ribosomal protein S18 acetylase RimI-like enzyme